MECRDRYFVIDADLSYIGNECHFEAVGKSSNHNLYIH